MRRLALAFVLLTTTALLQGCVGAAVSTAGAVVGTGISVTGKTVGAAKDVVFIAPPADRDL